jgi:hypothetical protein
MIDPKVAVIAHCNASEAVLAVFAHRITEDKIPDKQGYPHARVRQIGQTQDYHTTGEGSRGHMLQIDMYDDDLAGANANAEILRAAFSGYIGMMGGMLTGRVQAKIALSNNDEATRTYWRVIEVIIPTND